MLMGKEAAKTGSITTKAEINRLNESIEARARQETNSKGIEDLIKIEGKECYLVFTTQQYEEFKETAAAPAILNNYLDKVLREKSKLNTLYDENIDEMIELWKKGYAIRAIVDGTKCYLQQNLE